MRLAILNLFGGEPSSPQYNDQDVIVDVQLGPLMGLIGGFDDQFVKSELGLELAEQHGIGFVGTQPHDPVVDASEGADLLDVDVANPPAVTVERAGDYPRRRSIGGDS